MKTLDIGLERIGLFLPLIFLVLYVAITFFFDVVQ